MLATQHNQDAPAIERAHGRARAASANRPIQLKTALGSEHQLASTVLEAARNNHPTDLWEQLSYFLRNFRIDARRGRHRPASQRTTDKYAQTLRVFYGDLREHCNVKLRSLQETTIKHTAIAMRYWEGKGLSPSTLSNRYTVLKRYLGWLGKGRGMPELKQVLSNSTQGRRTTSATAPRAWEAMGIDVESKLREIEADCKYTAMHLRLQRHFGLRSTESLCLKPKESDQGTSLLVYRGTKGGRGRVVPIRNAAQRELLDAAKRMANKQTGLIGRYGHNLKAATNHYYYILDKHGIKRQGEGVTAHGLRHAYANDRYRDLTGSDAPVNGGAPVPHETEIAARRVITQELGHSRVYITTAYTGSIVNLDRLARKNLEALIDQPTGTELHEQLSREREKAATENLSIDLYVIGPEAAGKKAAPGAPLTMAISVLPTTGHAASATAQTLTARAAELAIRMNALAAQAYKRPCFMTDLRALPPETERLEILM